MSLRIPDDEVARPQSSAEPTKSDLPPVGSSPPTAAPLRPAPDEFAVLQPTPIISINSEVALPIVLEEPPPPSPPSDLDGVEVRFDDEPLTPLLSRAEALDSDDLDGAGSLEAAPIDLVALAPSSGRRPSPPPPDPERSTPPFEVARPAPLAVPPVLVQPAPPLPAPPVEALRPPPPAEPARAAPPIVPARTPVAEPAHEGAVGELSPDDLVSLDATPAPPPVLAELPSMRPKIPSHPPAPPPVSRKPVPTPVPRSARPQLVIVPPHMGNVAPQGREGAGPRRKGRFWWEDLFNDDYLRATERLTEQQIVAEVNFIEDSLGIERGGAVLDLACGTGRHAVELARRGYEVVGFDLSLPMLARASEEAQERSAKLNFVQGDMRDMSFAEQFDGVYCWNTSFGYFEEEKNALVVDRIHGALKAGGLLLLDVINRDFAVRQSPSLAWFEGDGCVCMDEMVVDFITSRLRTKRTMMLDDGRSREIEYSMRIYSLHELGKMLHEHGFKVCEVSGQTATPGVFLGHDSPRTIILAEKR